MVDPSESKNTNSDMDSVTMPIAIDSGSFSSAFTRYMIKTGVVASLVACLTLLFSLPVIGGITNTASSFYSSNVKLRPAVYGPGKYVNMTVVPIYFGYRDEFFVDPVGAKNVFTAEQSMDAILYSITVIFPNFFSLRSLARSEGRSLRCTP